MDEKYKEALNRAWSLREDGYKNKDVQETVEYIFPQLKQEKNMKEFIQNELACIRALEDKGSDRYNELTEAIKWLDEEKKEEQDSQSLLGCTEKESDEDEKIRNEILEYFLITHIRDFVANPERQKWISYIKGQKESGIRWYKSDNKNNPKRPYIDKAGMFYTTDGRMCYASEIEKQKEQTEELSTSLNGLMQEYVKSGKDEEEQEHRLKCYQLFWDALGDSEFFKQKEHKPVVTHGETYHVDTLGTQQVIAGKMPQKPTEWSEEDELMRTVVIQTLETLGGRGTTGMQIEWLKSIPLNLKKKNEDVAKLCSNEWSKEDERKLQKCIKIVERWEEDYDIAYAPYSNMLKSLCPQSKVEWSEEDEKILHSIKQCVYDNVANIGTVDKNRFIDWLESLRPSWKPSEEQMKALKVANLYWQGLTKEVPKTNELETLYNYLKKLK